QEELLRQTTRFGAAYYLLKPFDMKVFLHKIIEVYQQESTIASVVNEGDERLNQEENRLYLALLNCLEEAGIQQHVKGYQYIKEATWIGFEEIDEVSGTTKRVYLSVANT